MRMRSGRQGLEEGRGFSVWDIIEKVQPFRFNPTLSELAAAQSLRFLFLIAVPLIRGLVQGMMVGRTRP